jgi:lipopolysaccharide transport system ATP-binding protein
MSGTAINVEHLYKEYKLGVISHGTLYRDMQSWWAKVRGKEDPNSLISSHHGQEAERDSFLALNDVSFEVKEGDRLGIIGKNGAGKSTLLKILSRITSPSRGNIMIRGRVGSLLEVGTGFHAELTGRENIYLNGSILGMNRHEISRKLDEIVGFAGIEKHLDTPVKRYSSGMMVRLGFAVAAHLDTDILIADEVLAVGDAEFQKKALDKMGDLSTGEGRTVLFVSHNMGAVGKLCNQGVILERGKIKKQGDISFIIDEYDNSFSNKYTDNDPIINNKVYRRGSDTMRFVSVAFSRNKYTTDDDISLLFTIETFAPINKLYFLLLIKHSDGSPLTTIYHILSDSQIAAGFKNSFELIIPKQILRPGRYPLYLWIGDEQALTMNIPTNYEVLDEYLHPLCIELCEADKKSILGERISMGEITIHTKLKTV